MSGGVSYYVTEGYRRIKHIVMALPEDIAERLSSLQAGSSAISPDAWQALLDAAGKAMKPKLSLIHI